MSPRLFLKLLQDDQWAFRKELFGALSMFFGSVVVSIIAVLIAAPVALGSAVYASEYVSGKKRAVVKLLIETLASIPSVVYGLLGVLYLRDWVFSITRYLGAASGDSLLTASLLLALMILPTFMTLSDDALRCVPLSYRTAARSVGLTKTYSIFVSTLPFARKGILGAAFLSLGRAFGETIAVFLVVGRSDIPFNKEFFSLNTLVNAGQTITSKLGGAEISIAYGTPIHWGALLSLGVLLWVAVSAFSALHLYLIRSDS